MKNLKNVFTGKKSAPDESSTTRASLLTVSEQRHSYGPKYNRLICKVTLFFIFSSVSALSTATPRTQKTASCTARASASPPSPLTARSGQPRAAAATCHTHSGTTRSLTAWLLVLCVCWSTRSLASLLCSPPCMTADASNVSHRLTHPQPRLHL